MKHTLLTIAALAAFTIGASAQTFNINLDLIPRAVEQFDAVWLDYKFNVGTGTNGLNCPGFTHVVTNATFVLPNPAPPYSAIRTNTALVVDDNGITNSVPVYSVETTNNPVLTRNQFLDRLATNHRFKLLFAEALRTYLDAEQRNLDRWNTSKARRDKGQ